MVASQPPTGPPPQDGPIMSNNELVILRPGQAPELINVLNFYDNKYTGTIYLDNTLGESVDVQVTAEGPEGVQVPNVVGMTQAEAEAEFTAVGLALGDVTVDYSLSVPPGTVIYSDPPAGTFVVLPSVVDCVMNFSSVVVDNGDLGNTSSTGTWPVSTSSGAWNPDDPSPTFQLGSNGATFTWYWTAPFDGYFDVAEWHTAASTRNNNAQYIIEHAGEPGSDSAYVNQQVNGGQWNTMGSFRFVGGDTYMVTLIADGTNASCADAVRFTKIRRTATQIYNRSPGWLARLCL